MLAIWSGKRKAGFLLSAATLAAGIWLNYHITEPLNLNFDKIKNTTGEWILILLTTGICIPLIGAYWIQFAEVSSLPALSAAATGNAGSSDYAMMNLRSGTHITYAVTIFSAIFGGAVSTRQILLHVAPGNPNGPGYGSPVFGWHLYTWGLVIFVATIAVVGMMMLFEKHFDFGSPAAPRPMSKPVMAVFALVTFLAAANILSTFLMCGFSPCPDSPDQYLLLSRI